MLHFFLSILIIPFLHGGDDAHPFPSSQPLISPDADFLDMVDEYELSGSHPLHFGPQLAIEKVSYQRTNSSQISDNVWLGAVGLGDNDIAIFEVDFTVNPTITYLETYSYTDNNNDYDYFVFDPAFMKLQINGTDEWCLVVPIVERPVSSSGIPNGGDIMIIRLESRNADDRLITIENTLNINSYEPVEVYCCKENPDNGDYLISLDGSKGGSAYNLICVAEFRTADNQFYEKHTYTVPDLYFAHNNHSVPARTYEHFFFDTANDLAYFTNHNCGVSIWDYSNTTSSELPLETRIASQQGGWGGSENYVEELGDVHRAAVLECNCGSGNDSKLLFVANHTMGIMVWDVTSPENPLFVFQWDTDTKPYVWYSWRGAGRNSIPGLKLPPYPAAVTFGLDVCAVNGSTDYIHLYCGDGCDGIRTIDFSQFFFPWGGNYGEFSALDDNTYSYGSTDHWAYDLRTFQQGSSLYVLTSWREKPDAGTRYTSLETGTIALSLHRENTISLPVTLYSEQSSVFSDIQNEVHLTAENYPNPTTGSQVLLISSNHQTSCTVTAIDMAGRAVISEEIKLVQGSNSVPWTELSGNVLPSGNYLLRVVSSEGDEIIRKSVIIN
ncbi:hypothetical protein CSA37_01570 [Candidatus Fermentibacteria bacterium]|nr:MAG: hypothetical protein CSA37_13555 [Candidatus Fermentibacteria bacterium]PIE53372.1 MAG: hypothetical protein CSA37_01570 [Candidatus Fermentibacteria bacterium]